MSKEMYFKVTNQQNKSLYAEYQGRYAVQYKIGEFVAPKVGKLFVYGVDDIHSNGFNEYSTRSEVDFLERALWICECEGVELTTGQYPTLDDVINYIEHPNENYRLIGMTVYLAQRVKLIKQISVEELLTYRQNP